MTESNLTPGFKPTVRPPKPETQRAILISVAFEQPRPTQHRYVETVPVEFESPHVEDADKHDRRAWAFLYECMETGFRRRWGIVERTVDVPLEAYPIDETAGDEGGN